QRPVWPKLARYAACVALTAIGYSECGASASCPAPFPVFSATLTAAAWWAATIPVKRLPVESLNNALTSILSQTGRRVILKLNTVPFVLTTQETDNSMRHFLQLADWAPDELQDMLQLAVLLKAEHRNGDNAPLLQNKVLGLIFQKPSLRTRVSFEVGMRQLGGWALTLGPDEIVLGKRESIADISRVMSRYVHAVMARVFDHQHVIELARWSDVPVINGLSDEHHPCQALADILTIYEHYGRTQGLRVAYVGDGNNVAASLAEAAAHFGMHFRIATPPGYELSEAALETAADIARQTGGSIETYHDPAAALK